MECQHETPCAKPLSRNLSVRLAWTHDFHGTVYTHGNFPCTWTDAEYKALPPEAFVYDNLIGWGYRWRVKGKRSSFSWPDR